MPQRHRAGEDQKKCVKAKWEATWEGPDEFRATFMDNDRRKWSGKQLSEGTDLEQLYFCGSGFEGRSHLRRSHFINFVFQP